MYLKEFDVETWMTNHEQNCQYNLADTCVSDMSIHELESLIHKDLMGDLMHMRMDYGPITGSDSFAQKLNKRFYDAALALCNQ